MKKHPINVIIKIALAALAPFAILFLRFDVIATENPQENELFNTLPGSSQKDSILDATNPMDLLNKLRRATAMDDATTPSDAIDDALKAFETKDPIEVQ